MAHERARERATHFVSYYRLDSIKRSKHTSTLTLTFRHIPLWFSHTFFCLSSRHRRRLLLFLHHALYRSLARISHPNTVFATETATLASAATAATTRTTNKTTHSQSKWFAFWRKTKATEKSTKTYTRIMLSNIDSIYFRCAFCFFFSCLACVLCSSCWIQLLVGGGRWWGLGSLFYHFYSLQFFVLLLLWSC